MSVPADGAVAVQVIVGNLSDARWDDLKRALAKKGFVSQGSYPPGIQTRYNHVLQFFREPVSIAEFAGIPELVSRVERLMWEARIPHDWNLSQGQVLIVPRRFAARAKKILAHDPILGSEVDRKRP